MVLTTEDRLDNALEHINELQHELEFYKELEPRPNLVLRFSVALNCVLIVVIVIFGFLLADKV